jgi:hypothetical protein
MIRPPVHASSVRALLVVALSLVAGLALAACGPGGAGAPASGPGGDPAAAGAAATAVITPTVVARRPVTPTPDPLSAVPAADLPGVVVPAGATRTAFTAASAEADANADYTMPGTDTEALTAWFRTEMAKAGWKEDEERDGALIFLHGEQVSARYADEGLKRTCTVFFDAGSAPEGGTSFSIVAEAPVTETGGR